ncbi:hypothetical protein EDD37DRAFT_138765 [Exophiala viscosa]|uniref:Secreted protein n=1 Tax=Exophiala viscosa TaxID=2486360 RepID=A0AAN6DP46_9EURO|nr:hypothetical protein EDD36DRAFT_83901 [Exophiala viscosa]KAI1620944.1 hypothetical protein EDD37DRAFT_138765 [Exophiala viscosa]
MRCPMWRCGIVAFLVMILLPCVWSAQCTMAGRSISPTRLNESTCLCGIRGPARSRREAYIASSRLLTFLATWRKSG